MDEICNLWRIVVCAYLYINVMPIDNTALDAARRLSQTNDRLNDSISKLSSGKRLQSSSEDAAALSMAMNLNGTLQNNIAVQKNLDSAVSYLQTQQGVLKNSADIVDRLSELEIAYQDPAKSTSDKALLNVEALQLVDQLKDNLSETINGIRLFATTSAETTESKALYLDQGGLNKIDITQQAYY